MKQHSREARRASWEEALQSFKQHEGLHESSRSSPTSLAEAKDVGANPDGQEIRRLLLSAARLRRGASLADTYLLVKKKG